MLSVTKELTELGIKFRYDIDCVFAEMPYDDAWQLFSKDYIINEISHDVICIEEV